MTSRLISDLYLKVVSQRDIGKAFDYLMKQLTVNIFVYVSEIEGTVHRNTYFLPRMSQLPAYCTPGELYILSDEQSREETVSTITLKKGHTTYFPFSNSIFSPSLSNRNTL